MVSHLHNTTQSSSPELLNSSEIINTMIDLRIQLAELEQQIQALQPAFFAACLALNTDKITIERATITRRLTPGQCGYGKHSDEEQPFDLKSFPLNVSNLETAIRLFLKYLHLAPHLSPATFQMRCAHSYN